MVIRGVPIPGTQHSDEEVIAHLNSLIDKMKTYGVKMVRVLVPSYKLAWSNAGAEWYVAQGYGVFQPGKILDLDANEFLAPYRIDVLNRVVGRLNQLPLYSFSTEARMKGSEEAPPPWTKHWTWPAVWEEAGH